MEDGTKAGHVPEALPSKLDAQALLPGMEEVAFDIVPAGEAPSSPMGIFSAARFFDERPETYNQVARALFEGLADAQIARIWGLHQRTVAAVRAREERSQSAESYRQDQAKRIRKVTAAAVDKIAEKIEKEADDISAKDLAFIADRLGNQERVLEGAPTAIVGVLRPDGAAAKLAELLQSVEQETKTIDITPEEKQ